MAMPCGESSLPIFVVIMPFIPKFLLSPLPSRVKAETVLLPPLDTKILPSLSMAMSCGLLKLPISSVIMPSIPKFLLSPLPSRR